MPRTLKHFLSLAVLLPFLWASSTVLAQQSSTPQAELFLQLQQLQEEVARLRGLLEEQQNTLNKLQRENIERYQALERRLSDNSISPSPATNPNPPATADVTPTAEPPAPADVEQEKLYYDAAFELIKTRDFDQAEQALSGFLHRYPKSQYAANAQYWLGEVYLVKGQTEAARLAFAQVADNWPEHAKVPDALYKQADAAQRLGQNDEARRLLREVIKQYPNSSAAKLAQRDLQQNS